MLILHITKNKENDESSIQKKNETKSTSAEYLLSNGGMVSPTFMTFGYV